MPMPPVPELSREEIERRVIAVLIMSPNQKRHVERLDPKLFQVPAFARLAERVVTLYRIIPFVEHKHLRAELNEEDQKLFDDILRNGPFLHYSLDPIAVLAGEQRVPVEDPKPVSRQNQVTCAPLADFASEPRQWLWHGRMELGQLMLIGGEAGSGKSLLACDLAARITAGRAWPDGAAAAPPGSVLLVASGDDVSGLWRPRLEAAGAEIGRVHVLPIEPVPPPPKSGERGSPFRALLKALEAAVAAVEECRLVVIDPLRLTIGDAGTTIDGDRAARLELLAAFARRQQVAVLGLASVVYEDRRRKTCGDALKLATAACAATAWQVVRHPYLKRVRLFLPAKTIRSSDLEGQAFTVAEEPAGERVEWQAARLTGDILDAHPRGDAAAWLRQALACGPLASKEIFQLAGENGYTPRMLHYAKATAGVAVARDGVGRGATWRWTLELPNSTEHAKTV